MAPHVREAVCRDAAWLGIGCDAKANAAGGPRISAEASRVPTFIILTDENLMIARHSLIVASQQQGKKGTKT